MKIYQQPLFGAILAFLLVSAHPSRGDTLPIISEWNPSIQFIKSERFISWPGVETSIPVDVSAEAGRIWLIWPTALVSLNSEGRSDEYSLLSLFSSVSAEQGSNRWSPESGIMCSDGIWRSFESGNPAIKELNPVTGLIRRRYWNRPVPDTIYPGPEGSLLCFSDTSAYLIYPGDSDTAEADTVEMDEELPPISMISLSREGTLVAWRELSSGMIRYGKLLGGHVEEQIDLSVRGTFWGMDWSGDLLILSGPGKLTAIRNDGKNEIEIGVLEDARLPKRWYRIRGSRENLLIHSPETGLVAMIGKNTLSSAPEDHSDGGTEAFEILLKENVLKAGSLLETWGYQDQAVRFYSWVLPQIRSQRSRDPMDEAWPELEHAVTDRWAELRNQF